MELERHASTPRSLHCKFGVGRGGGLNFDNIVTTNSNVLLEEATSKEEWVVSECNLASLVANSESWQARCRGADMKLRRAHLLILDFRLGIGNVGVGLGILYSMTASSWKRKFPNHFSNLDGELRETVEGFQKTRHCVRLSAVVLSGASRTDSGRLIFKGKGS
jgi:hypothetical protein